VSPVATLVSSTLPELLDDRAAWEFVRAGVAAAAGLRTGLRCAAAALQRPAGGSEHRLREIAATARTAGTRGRESGQWLAEHEAKVLLQTNGVSVPRGRLVTDEDDAACALHELGGSLALKCSSSTIQHKSELGGVALGLATAHEVRGAYRRLAALAEVHGGQVLAERMVPGEVELIVSARTDGVVPALVLGLGGIWTELLDDVAIVPLPAGAARVELALRSLRGAPVLLGGRGGNGVDLPAAARLAERIAAVLVERSLAEVECNPVLVGPPGAGAVAVDAAIRLRGES
jgi:acyl-CoA synthetase (NDP forming)